MLATPCPTAGGSRSAPLTSGRVSRRWWRAPRPISARVFSSRWRTAAPAWTPRPARISSSRSSPRRSRARARASASARCTASWSRAAAPSPWRPAWGAAPHSGSISLRSTRRRPRRPLSAPVPAAPLAPDMVETPPARGETILLVEDALRVRAVVREILEMNGYHVLEARHGAEAIEISERHRGPIHLMVTDVVMPQMSGRELAQRLLPVRPDMRVLYMSGYTDDAIVRHGVLGGVA